MKTNLRLDIIIIIDFNLYHIMVTFKTYLEVLIYFILMTKIKQAFVKQVKEFIKEIIMIKLMAFHHFVNFIKDFILKLNEINTIIKI